MTTYANVDGKILQKIDTLLDHCVLIGKVVSWKSNKHNALARSSPKEYKAIMTITNEASM